MTHQLYAPFNTTTSDYHSTVVWSRVEEVLSFDHKGHRGVMVRLFNGQLRCVDRTRLRLFSEQPPIGPYTVYSR